MGWGVTIYKKIIIENRNGFDLRMALWWRWRLWWWWRSMWWVGACFCLGMDSIEIVFRKEELPGIE